MTPNTTGHAGIEAEGAVGDSKGAVTPTRVYPGGTPLPPANPDDDVEPVDWHSVIPSSAPATPTSQTPSAKGTIPRPAPATGQKAQVLANVRAIASTTTGAAAATVAKVKPKKGRKKAKEKAAAACDCCGLDTCTCQCLVRGQHDHDAASCCACCPANGGGAQQPAESVEKTDDDQTTDDDEGDESPVTRAWRQAKALKALARVEGRRRAALLYLPGTALAWGLDWHRRVIAYMEAGYVAPDQLIGSLIGLAALGGGLWLAIRKKSRLLAATSFVVAGVGYADGGTRAVDYMTAHGFDPAIVTPVGSALLFVSLTWWFIDRRTANWFPPLACVMRTPTAAIGLALIFYVAPIL
ncbi:hypothetical protein [Streptomyces phaeochromogenes]